MDTLADFISLANVFLLGYLLVTKNFMALIGVFTLMLLIGLIKDYIKEPRPVGAKNCDLTNSGGPTNSYGMPSGHVAIMACILVFLQVKPIFLIPCLALMSWSRVHRGCHTTPQTLAGALVGASFGWAWSKVDIV